MKQLQPAVFLDRDGVVIKEAHYLAEPEQVRLIPGSAAAIAALNQAGFRVVVVTNQSGVARGLFPLEAITTVHEHIGKLLQEQSARIDAFYYCPHHPDAEVAAFRQDCECRKPKPGLLLQAAAECSLDLAQSWMFGDRVSDLAAGAAAGCRTILVRTGYGVSVNVQDLDHAALKLAGVADNLFDAVNQLGLVAIRSQE